MLSVLYGEYYALYLWVLGDRLPQQLHPAFLICSAFGPSVQHRRGQARPSRPTVTIEPVAASATAMAASWLSDLLAVCSALLARQ